MKYVDLHVHSNASDGTMSPSQVVAYAASKNLSAMALTDHDTVEGVQEALTAAASLPVEVIPGMELSALYHEKEIHILGLFADYKNPQLLKQLENLRAVRSRRNSVILERLAAERQLAAFKHDGFWQCMDTVRDKQNLEKLWAEKNAPWRVWEN